MERLCNLSVGMSAPDDERPDTLGGVLDDGLLPDLIPDLGSTDGLDSETESDPEP